MNRENKPEDILLLMGIVGIVGMIIIVLMTL